MSVDVRVYVSLCMCYAYVNVLLCVSMFTYLCRQYVRVRDVSVQGNTGYTCMRGCGEGCGLRPLSAVNARNRDCLPPTHSTHKYTDTHPHHHHTHKQTHRHNRS
eukprot:GHVQ01020011.1.p1 GENE.GHVQ01020011.1~~GHVQ01020011.1.p1  ORF type:complete len:104 (+),score=9.30 GHVQ01020011.1:1659-1970(+)